MLAPPYKRPLPPKNRLALHSTQLRLPNGRHQRWLLRTVLLRVPIPWWYQRPASARSGGSHCWAIRAPHIGGHHQLCIELCHLLVLQPSSAWLACLEAPKQRHGLLISKLLIINGCWTHSHTTPSPALALQHGARHTGQRGAVRLRALPHRLQARRGGWSKMRRLVRLRPPAFTAGRLRPGLPCCTPGAVATTGLAECYCKRTGYASS